MMPSQTASTAKTREELENWIKTAKNRVKSSKCSSCKSPFKEKIDEILEAMVRLQAYQIRRRDVYNKLLEDCPSFPLSFHGFEQHLIHCVRDLWNKAKGKA
jgi:hypothetical protein